MNELWITLAWLAFQVTLVALPATALHLLASRRGPAAGAWVAATSLIIVVALAPLTFVPRPWKPPSSARPSAVPRVAQSNIPTETVNEGGHDDGGTQASRGWPGLEEARSLVRVVASRVNPTTAPERRWTNAAAIVAILGMCLGLLRLATGLWAVRDCRRRGRPIEEASALSLLESLKAALNHRGRVELRELPELASPATAGWTRPVVFLPGDWRKWSETDLRAVLAHELAHIERSDYVIGLMARLALALNFYHPVVRWLAARVQMQQELAADAMGASLAGGRGPYLAALSRMALLQERRIAWWPARAFSPAKGTLIRRIRMLRSHEESVERPWTGPVRWLVGLTLTALALGVWTLPAPVQGADEPAAAPKAGPPATSPHVLPAFDLSYLPDDAMGVVAIHPAALFRRKGMGIYASQLNALKKLKGLDKAAGAPFSECPLSIEQIEQISGSVRFGRTVQQGKELGTFMVAYPTIRTVGPFDWLTYLRSLWPSAVELREGSKVFYGVKCPWLGPNLSCFYAPDDRTVVMGEEASIRRLLRRENPGVPEFARGADWKRVEHDLIAIAIDNHDEQIKRATRKLTDEEEFGKFLDHSNRWVCGLADSDELRLKVTATGRDPDSTQAMAALIAKLRDDGLKEMDKEHKGLKAEEVRMFGYLQQLLREFRITTDRDSLAILLAADVKLADLVPLLAQNGL
jgi:beta-lactamase regulating signal transducer with metallopeptidase domain